MSEPILDVGGAKSKHGALARSIQQGVKRASLRRPQSCLDFRPAQFNRVEVWRIRRQEFQACSPGFNQLTDGLAGIGRPSYP